MWAQRALSKMVVVQAQARIDFILNNHIDFDRKNYMDIPIPLSAYGMRRWKWLALGGAGAAAIPIVFFAVKTKDAQGIDDCDPYHLKAQISDDAEDKGFLAYLSKLLIDFGKISEKSSAAKGIKQPFYESMISDRAIFIYMQYTASSIPLRFSISSW